MNLENIYNPALCPGALDEEGEISVDPGVHRWDDTTAPHTCAECGTERDEFTDPKN